MYSSARIHPVRPDQRDSKDGTKGRAAPASSRFRVAVGPLPVHHEEPNHALRRTP